MVLSMTSLTAIFEELCLHRNETVSPDDAANLVVISKFRCAVAN